MNRIKKFFGICEHDWILVYIKRTSYFDTYGSSKHYDSLSFTANIICKKCGRHRSICSDFFDKSSISSSMLGCIGTTYWYSMDDCREALLRHPNAQIVKKSFVIKLNKKYNLNLTIKDL
mgnify:CR=1 FL=1